MVLVLFLCSDPNHYTRGLRVAVISFFFKTTIFSAPRFLFKHVSGALERAAA